LVATNSDLVGTNINSANYPALAGKLMVFAAWMKGPFTAADGLASLGVNNVAVETGVESINTWQLKAGVFTMPASGNVTCYVRKLGAAGAIQICCPVLAVLGADIKRLMGNFGEQTVFKGTAAPTVGTWRRGDTVINTTPSAAGVPGWVCTTAGAPGTWKAMAVLAA
jgi:hypothetical protein